MSADSDNPADVDHMLLIVVGAHLQAELSDRPLGYRLRQAVGVAT